MPVMQIKLDVALLNQLDKIAAERKTSRSKVAEDTLRDAIRRQMDEQAIAAHKKQAVTEDEVWPAEEQAWPVFEETAAWKEAKSGGSASKRPTKGGPSSSSRGNR